MAKKEVCALLISKMSESFSNLKSLLKNQAIEIWTAENCEEAARMLDQAHPELVFTSAILPDGTWADVVRIAEKTSRPTNVIVVGSCKDTTLYLSAMDFGAFDFVLPPFEIDPIAHVVRVAAENARRRRDERSVQAEV